MGSYMANSPLTPLIRFTTGLVGLMGLAVYLSLTAMKPSAETLTEVLPVRNPAGFSAAPGAIEKLVQDHERMATLQLDCKNTDTSNPWQVKASLVRLSGYGCIKKGANMDVVNHTNGRVATVFPLEEDGFTTDYMDLSVGENQVSITTQDADGQPKTTQVKIIRSK